MMLKIADQIHGRTQVLTLPRHQGCTPGVLDLCMAPGGFTKAVLRHNRYPNVRARGISLPAENGGHALLINGWETDDRIQVRFLDITMLAVEMGAEVPASHLQTEIQTDHSQTESSTSHSRTNILTSHSQTSLPTSHSTQTEGFLSDRPFLGDMFDLIFCDGQVLRTHARAEWRLEHREAGRLVMAQLVLALQRIRQGGSIVMLLHKADMWRTVELLHTFRGFADSITLVKPTPMHAKRSSFYMIAKGIQPESLAAQTAGEKWKRDWYVATFGSAEEYADNRATKKETVDSVLAEFGEELCHLAEPVWEVQVEALRDISDKGWSSKPKSGDQTDA
jgi:23S rRNA U2552 (ribose-2'-O)-methylase RlmE/FtsJ